MFAITIPVRARPKVLETVQGLPEEGCLWLDFDRALEPDWAARVQELTGRVVHDNHVRDSLNPQHPSYSDSAADYEMIVFRGLSPESGGTQILTRSTTFFVFDRLLVTVRPEEALSAVAIRNRLLTSQERVPRRIAGILQAILSAMVDRYLEQRPIWNTRLEQWQRDLLDATNPFDDWPMLMDQRNTLRRLETLCEEQQDAITRWLAETSQPLESTHKIRFRDLLEHVQRVLSHSQHVQAEIDSLVQMHFSATAHRTNEIVRVLTVLSAIFLPLTFLAGVFGMNFENMPELHYRNSYFVVLGLMAGLGLGLFLYFRRKRWF